MASSDIVVSPVAGKADLKAFIDLPKRLYFGHKGYIPHLPPRRRTEGTLLAGEESAVPPRRGAVLSGAPRRAGRRPHHGPGRPRLSRALCRFDRPLRLPGRRG